MKTDYTVKIVRDGMHCYAFTITTPDGQISVRETGFGKRDAAVAQAEVALKELKEFQEVK